MATTGKLGWRGLACACIAAGLLVSAPVSAAGAATTIGQLDPGTPTGHCVGTSNWVQSAIAGGASYTVPAGQWVLVSWNHRAKASAGRELALRVWRATSTTGTYALVGAGALRVLTPGGINTFYERIAVAGGDLLGLRVGNPGTGFPDIGGGASCWFTAGLGDTIRYGSGDPAAGATAAFPAPLTPNRLNVTARLESDADADGFGDETQDSCPGSAGPAGGCAASGGTGPTPGKDTTPPRATLTARRDSIRDGRVAVWVTANESATLTAKGTLSIGPPARVHRLRTATAKAVANKRERVLLRLARRTRKAAARALRRGRILRVRIWVTVRDAAGNVGTAQRPVFLKR